MSTASEDTAARGRVALLRALLDPYRGRVIAATVATVVGTVAKLIPPYLAGRVVDDVIKTGSTRTLGLIAIALVGSLTVLWLAQTAETWLVGDVGQRALMDLRLRLVDHLQTLSMSYYDRASAGRVMSRVTKYRSLRAASAFGSAPLVLTTLRSCRLYPSTVFVV